MKKTIVVNLFGGPGTGKCFGRNTEVLMYDGTIKYIQDIKIGDIVMGDDSTPRKVLNTHRGTSKLYELVVNKNDNLIVSDNHILCLARQKRNDRKGVRTWVNIDISIEDYLDASKKFRETSKLYQVPVRYPEKELGIDPYYLGLWLGDGLSESITRFCSADNEIVQWCTNYANKLGITLKQHSYKTNTKCQTYCFSEGNIGFHSNHPIAKYDNIYKLTGNKHIPLDYLTSSEEQRLQLLAGLVDSDGYVKNNYIEITQKNLILADDIMRLCCSLGMNAYKRIVYKKSQTMDKDSKGNKYYIVSVSGDLTRIPTKLPRKTVIQQNKNKNPLHRGFKVNDYGVGEYFGIEIDGNQKFLLKNCMVVHNSTGAAYVFSMLKMQGINVELVTEFAKDKTWESNFVALSNQAYVFGKQYYKISRCADQVDVIVTDSPLLLSTIYNNNPVLGETFNQTVLNVFNSYDNMNYVLNRVKPYNPIGRNQTEQESDDISKEIISMLEDNNINFEYKNGSLDGYSAIYTDVLKKVRGCDND